MSLSGKQQEFTQAIGKLIEQAYLLGYGLTFGDAFRGPSVPYGHPQSCHRKRLAVDFNLFKDGKYLTETEDYLELGEYWESLHPYARWGGRFNDGNHFSFTHDGVS